MPQNLLLNSLKFLAVDLIGEILYFPVWWYSFGAEKTALYLGRKFLSANASLGVSVWLKNFFKPMYNQTDWQSVLISLAMRLVQILARSVALLVYGAVLLALFFLWLALPIFIIYQIADFFR